MPNFIILRASTTRPYIRRASAARPYIGANRANRRSPLLALLLIILALTGCDSGGRAVLPTPTPDATLSGKIAFYKTQVDGSLDLYAMNANGTSEVRLTAGLKVGGEPKWGADGNSILFVAQPYSNTQQVYLIRLAAGAVTPINLSHNSYDETFANWSPDGSRIVFASNRSGGYQVYTMKADGSDVQPLTLSQKYGYSAWPAWSPDGKRIAYTAGGAPDQTELYVINADGSGVVQLTSLNSLVARPVWSPDSSKIAFTFQKGVAPQNRYNIYLTNADHTGLHALTTGDTIDNDAVWSPDGSHVAFYSNLNGNQSSNTFTIKPDASGAAQLTSSGGLYPSYSPDGKQIIYASRPAVGQPYQLYVMNSDGSNQRRLTVDDGEHSFPVWGR